MCDVFGPQNSGKYGMMSEAYAYYVVIGLRSVCAAFFEAPRQIDAFLLLCSIVK